MPIPILFSVFAFLMGIVLGSFGNVLIYRLPAGKSIGGRSACPRCGHTLRLYDLIPILSFFLLGARCRSCKRAISWQYPLVETAGGLLFLHALYREFSAFSPLTPSLLSALLLAVCLWLLLLIAVTDAKTGMIPDALNIPFLLLAVLYSLSHGSPFFLPMAIGAGFFGLQWIVSRGTWVGSGDIILAAGIGAFLGSIPLLFLSLWIAYVGGGAVAMVLVFQKAKTMQGRLAFGPFLVAGTCVAFVWGEMILGKILGT